MKKMFLSGVAALFIFAGMIAIPAWGWQNTWPADYREKVTTRAYEADYNQVYDTIIKFCIKNGYSLVTEDRRTGIIATDYIPAGDIAAGHGQLKLNFLISRQDERITLVHLNIKFAMNSGTGLLENANGPIDEDNYDDIFNGINDMLKT